MFFFTGTACGACDKYEVCNAPDFQVNLPVAPHLVVGFRREEKSWVQVPIQVIKGRSTNKVTESVRYGD